MVAVAVSGGSGSRVKVAVGGMGVSVEVGAVVSEGGTFVSVAGKEVSVGICVGIPGAFAEVQRKRHRKINSSMTATINLKRS